MCVPRCRGGKVARGLTGWLFRHRAAIDPSPSGARSPCHVADRSIPLWRRREASGPGREGNMEALRGGGGILSFDAGVLRETSLIQLATLAQ